MTRNAGFPLVEAIVLAYCSFDDAVACVGALRTTRYPNLRISVIDNASPDGTGARLLEALGPSLVTCLPRNTGYAGGNNWGMERAMARDAKFALLLNPDVRVPPDAIAHYIDVMEREPLCAALNSVQLTADGRAVDDKFYRGVLGGAPALLSGFIDHPLAMLLDVSKLLGAALFMRLEVVRRDGGFDPLYFAYSEEIDLCRRWRARGHRLLVTNREPVIHIRSHEAVNEVDDFRLFLRLKGQYLYQLKDPKKSFGRTLKEVLRSIAKLLLGRPQHGYPFDEYALKPRHAMRSLAWLVAHLPAVVDHRRRDITGRRYRT